MAIARIKPRIWWPGLRRDLPISRGLVGYWPMWEGAGDTVRDIAGLNDGIATNTTWTPRGLLYPGSGDNRVEIPGNDAFLGGNGGVTQTIAAWIFLNGWGTNNFGRVLSYFEPAGSNGGWEIYVQSSGARLTYDVYDGAGGSQQYQSPTSSIELSRWFHIAIVRDGSFLQWYIDGEPSGSPVAQTVISSTSPTPLLKIGNRSTDNAREFDGLIDIPSIWNQALGISEIQQLANPATQYDLITPKSTTIISVGDVAPPTGAIMNQLQTSNLGADLFNGTLL